MLLLASALSFTPRLYTHLFTSSNNSFNKKSLNTSFKFQNIHTSNSNMLLNKIACKLFREKQHHAYTPLTRNL